MRKNSTRPFFQFAPMMEALESRTLFAATPAQVVLSQATSINDKSISVSYSIASAAVTQALKFDFYRSDAPTVDATSALIGSQTLAATDLVDLSVGNHTVQLISGTTLTPNVAQPYIVAVANADGSVTEADGSINTTYFRTFMLGVVSHGLELTGTTIPAWETTMAADLKSVDHYDDAIAFNWVTQSRQAKSGQAVAAGHTLSAQVKTRADALAAGHAGDVVDLHFIGHSRGAVVISTAMADFIGTTDKAIAGGFIKATYLDPHPASSATTRLYSGSALAGLAINLIKLSMKDPAVTVPSDVGYVEVYYQHSPYQDFVTIDPTEYSTVNLWGEGPSDGIINKSPNPIHWTNLSSPLGNTTTAIGHSEVPLWYISTVVDQNRAALLA